MLGTDFTTRDTAAAQYRKQFHRVGRSPGGRGRRRVSWELGGLFACAGAYTPHSATVASCRILRKIPRHIVTISISKRHHCGDPTVAIDTTGYGSVCYHGWVGIAHRSLPHRKRSLEWKECRCEIPGEGSLSALHAAPRRPPRWAASPCLPQNLTGGDDATCSRLSGAYSRRDVGACRRGRRCGSGRATPRRRHQRDRGASSWSNER